MESLLRLIDILGVLVFALVIKTVIACTIDLHEFLSDLLNGSSDEKVSKSENSTNAIGFAMEDAPECDGGESRNS